MRFPKKLKYGDTIAIIAPSSPVPKEKLEKCQIVLKDMGYKVKVGQSAYESVNGYMAGSAKLRADEINSMFADKQVDAIFCIRGGYTSCKVMEYLDYDIIKNNPKIFVGYSDVTSYNIAFNQKCDFVTYHGPMVCSNMISQYDDFTKKSFEDALNMEDELELKNPEGEEFKVLVKGHAEGRITGGNMTLVTPSIGTDYEIDTKGKVLFIEEIDESVPKIEKMLYQLKYSGKFDDCVGVLIGDFSGCENTYDESYNVIRLMEDFFEDFNKPVMYNIKSGHCSPMSTIILGAVCTIDTDTKTIKFSK